MNTEIKSGDLIKVTTEDGEIGVGYVYNGVQSDENPELYVDISWATGGSTESICLESTEIKLIEKVTLTKS